MAQNLSKFLASLFGPRVISDVLSNQDPKELGSDLGKGLKRAILGQINQKAYLAMSLKLITWADALYVAFRREINEP